MMKVFLASLSLVILTISAASQTSQDRYVKGEVLIKVEAGRQQFVNQKLSSFGASAVENLGDLGWQRIKIADGKLVETSLKEFSGIPGIVAVQPNFYYRLQAIPNDPQFPAAGMWGLTKISAPTAWDLSTGSSAIVVANIDTGVRYTHEDLAANMWTNPGEIPGNGVDDDNNGLADDFYGYDFRFNDPDPFDEISGFGGHGSHTAGTVGAVGNNATGVVGINWNVRIMAIKIYSAAGTDTTSAMLINAYNYVRMMKSRGVNIRVTNNSYGGCNEACGFDQATKDAIDAMGDAGILNVFAAGNSGTNNETTPHFPSNYTSPSILAVTASDINDNRAFNYGAISVDLGAPGVGILSTISSSNAAYGTKSGTSMATPHVTGAAALLAAHNPNLSVASLKATIMNTVDVLPAWNGVVKSGGRLNLANALQNQTVCTFNLSTTAISVRTKGGYYMVGMTAPNNCDFLVKSNVNWIRVDPSGAGSGTGPVSFRVNVNPTITRSGTISIAGQTVTVTQSRQ